MSDTTSPTNAPENDPSASADPSAPPVPSATPAPSQPPVEAATPEPGPSPTPAPPSIADVHPAPPAPALSGAPSPFAGPPPIPTDAVSGSDLIDHLRGHLASAVGKVERFIEAEDPELLAQAKDELHALEPVVERLAEHFALEGAAAIL